MIYGKNQKKNLLRVIIKMFVLFTIQILYNFNFYENCNYERLIKNVIHRRFVIFK